jgi:hypothetical protein
VQRIAIQPLPPTVVQFDVEAEGSKRVLELRTSLIQILDAG